MLDTVTCDSKLTSIKFDDVNTQTFSVLVPIEIVFVSKQNSWHDCFTVIVWNRNEQRTMSVWEVSNTGEQSFVIAGLE